MNKTTTPFSLRALLTFLFGVLSLLQIVAVRAEPLNEEERTLSPYFFVNSGDATLDQLPLKSTRVDAKIDGVIANVTLVQVYANTGQTPLEAIYVFPASTRAAVHAMKMTIGERTVVAKIEKREEARQQYEQAKREGKSASLLEQQRPNVFQMNLANIMPGDEIKVEMRYTELLVPEDGVYEFVYPTVVGPRYSNLPQSKAGAADQWVANPTLHQGEAPTSTFDIKVDIAGGMPIKDAACTSHPTNIQFDGPQTAVVRLDAKETHGGNRDFILRYRLDGDKIQTGLLLQPGENENFFLLMMQPPQRVTPEIIPGREYRFIVDVSGSMYGFPLDTSKTLLRNLIGGLRPSDRFNILLFSGGNTVMAEESLPATAENLQKAIDLIDRQQGGGTELLPALQRTLAMPARNDFAQTIVIATDGYVTVEEEVFDLIRNNLDQANMFAFGIGSSVNRHIIEGMARVGMGEPFVITKPNEAAAAAERFRKLIETPVLTGISAKFDGFDAYDVEPIKIPDILAQKPLLIFGKYRGKPTGHIRINGVAGHGPFDETIDVARFAPSANQSALSYLWARHRITLLSDYNKLQQNDQRVAEVTELGLKYNLLTAYTSFIAIDSQVRNKEGRTETVKQPLPMPEGVSDYAVGGNYALRMAASAGQRNYAPPPPASARALASAPRPFSPAISAQENAKAERSSAFVSAQDKVSSEPTTSTVGSAATILFAFGQATLRPDEIKQLDKFIAQIKSGSFETIVITGHADRLEDGNGRRLSEQRAKTVKDYLISQGIAGERIRIEGKGNAQPLTKKADCSGADKEKNIACLQNDRRVEIRVIGMQVKSQ